MSSNPTRRTLTKLLLAAPAALSVAPLACTSTSGSASSADRLPPAERKRRDELARSTAQLQKNVAALAQLELPAGSEPAIYFSPLLTRK
ncbi:MAG TPA: hypothetical protein VIA45_08070 [Thermoanaerobaculia bacterium]|jgi:hypothetical protein